jgi:hypothetical protein
MGFHTDLEATAIARFFASEGFEVLGVDALGDDVLSRLADKLEPKQAVTFARAILDAGARMAEVIGALIQDDPPAVPPKLFDDIASKITRAELDDYRRLLESRKADLLAHALPLVEHLCGAKRTKSKPKGALPAELSRLLGAFDGVSKLGVLSAAEVVAQTTARRERVAKKPRWQCHSECVRSNSRWQDGWTVFAIDGDRAICIDESPTAKGRAGQVIAVELDPPKLDLVSLSLGDWLWRQLGA